MVPSLAGCIPRRVHRSTAAHRCIPHRKSLRHWWRPEWMHGSTRVQYQAMTSLRDLAHDGWMCKFIICTCIPTTAMHISSQLGSSCQGNRYGTENTGGTARPSRKKSHLPSHSPPASQAGRLVGPALKPLASLVKTIFTKKEHLANYLFYSCEKYFCVLYISD